MTADAGAARYIPVTSEDATVQADRERLARENGERRFRQLRGLPEPAPVVEVKPAPKPRTKVVVKTIPAPQQSAVTSSTVRPPAGVPQPRRGAGPGPTTPPGSDEVLISREELRAVAKLIDAQPWSKSGKRGSVGRNKS